jgi:MFS transporter, DHA1 family, tetracycline resistance protein
MNLCTNIPVLFTVPFIGIWSDKFGRKPILLLSLTSSLVGYLATLSVAWLQTGLWILLLAHVMQGLMGSWTLFLSTVMVYLADISGSGERSLVFVRGEAFAFAALSIGPILGGYLARVGLC